MKEEIRLERLNQRKKEESAIKKLNKKIKKLDKLSKDKKIKKYLKLKSKLENKEVRTKTDFRKIKFLETSFECDHDIWFLMGSYGTDYDDEEKEITCYETNIDHIEYYTYYCLECLQTINIPVDENQEFLSKHNVIRINKGYIDMKDYEYYRNYYDKLLENNSTKKAFKKLVKIK